MTESSSLPRAIEEGIERMRAALEACVSRKLCGHASVFDVVTEIPSAGGGFREVVRRGAFARALKSSQDVVCHFAHGVGAPLPLGRVSSGTLRLWEDSVGLAFECQLPDTSEARDLAVSVARKDVKAMSFAFQPAVTGERWTPGGADGALRELLDVDLFDISPVINPAYTGTSVGLRAPVADVDRERPDLDPGAGALVESFGATTQQADLEGLRLAIEIAKER